MEREGAFVSGSYIKELIGSGEAIKAFGKRLIPGLTGIEDIPGVTDTRRCRAWW